MASSLNILIIEDDTEDAFLIQRSLQKCSSGGVKSTHKSSLQDGIREYQAQSNTYDAVLLDLNLGDSRGLKTVRTILSVVSSIPVIVLSEITSSELSIEAMAEGAQDYVSKRDIESNSILQKVTYAIERQRLINELNKTKNELSQLANFKSRFLAQMSHEIRTPMNGVIGNTSLLLEEPLTVEQREMVEAIRQSGESLINIINDILDISKFESGAVELRPKRFNVRELVEETLELMAPLAEAKDLAIIDMVDPSVPKFALADYNRLKQILCNLVTNAIKYTDRGHICVKVSLASSEGQNFLKMEVSDTGRGIPESKLSTLFNPYMQVSYADQFIGTGLGLAICQKLTKLMSGEIGVSSKEGKGSCFWFTIGCTFEGEDHGQRANLSNKRVALVSADEAFSDILEKQLHQRGMLTTAKTNFTSDLLKSVANAFDLILLNTGGVPESDVKSWLERYQNGNPSLSVPALVLSFRKNLKQFAVDRSKRVIAFPIRQSVLYGTMAQLLGGELATVAVGAAEQNVKARRKQKPSVVLVVDDVDGNLKVASKMLVILGHKVEVARDGSEAIEACKKQKFDLVLMDCKMPGISGFEATQAIRNSFNPNTSTPIIALTANALSEERARFAECGMNDSLAKPIKIEDLASMLECWIECEAAPSSPLPVLNDAPIKESVYGDGSSLLDHQAISGLKQLSLPSDEVPFLDDLILTFSDETPEIVANLKQALEGGDSRKIEHFSHKLKGFSRNLGASVLAALCDKIELNAANWSEKERLNFIGQVALVHAQTMTELSQYRTLKDVPKGAYERAASSFG